MEIRKIKRNVYEVIDPKNGYQWWKGNYKSCVYFLKGENV